MDPRCFSMTTYLRARLLLTHVVLSVALLLALCPFPLLAAASRGEQTDQKPVTNATADPTPVAAADALSTLFIPNHGQFDRAGHFQLRSPNGLLLFAPDAVTLALGDSADSDRLPLQLRFAGANPQPIVEGTAPAGPVMHLFNGNDPTAWRTDLALHSAIRYRQLYPGIDLQYDTTEGLLKGTYVVAPGVDPTQIRWSYHGVAAVAIDPATGDLQITPSDGQGTAVATALLTEKAPIAWQERNGQRLPVAVRFVLQSPVTSHQSSVTSLQSPTIRFHLGPYDPTLPLIIDPTLEYATGLAYSSPTFPAKVATDAQGNVYVVGAYDFSALRYSPLGQPIVPRGLACERLRLGAREQIACHDAFVMKLDPNGRLQYIVSLGGSYNDTATSLVPDNQGNLYVAGVTHSSDFPRTTPFTPGANVATCEAFDRTRLETVLTPTTPTNIYDRAFLNLQACAAFVVKLDSAGQLQVASYLPLTSSARANSIALDGDGNVWVGGLHGTKAFLLKLTADLAQQLYFNDSFAGDSSNLATLAFDHQGRVWMAGTAFGSPANPGTDAYLVRMAADGSGLKLAFFGLDTAGTDLAIDAGGAVYLAGTTCGPNLQSYLDPVVANGANGPVQVVQPTYRGGCDAFVAKYKPDFSKHYVTYLGGTAVDHTTGVAITADDEGNAYIFGTTVSADFPTVASIQPFAFGPQGLVGREVSTFLTMLNPFGTARLFSTFFGGEGPTIRAGSGNPSDLENSDFASSVTLDRNQKLWVTGYTTSKPFPNVNGYASCCGGGGRNGFLARFDPATYPLIFIPGVASSTLVDENDTEYWLSPLGFNQFETTLFPDVPHPDLFAKDILRKVLGLGPFGIDLDKKLGADRSIPGGLITFLTAHGYREYRDNGNPTLRTLAGCDLVGQQANSPNLFVFPYDWRIDNSTTAMLLREYIGCVRQFYPNAEVNILAHSMGNFVTRRYLLQNPTDHHVNGWISVGAPFLGGPKLAYVLETGDFGVDVVLKPFVKAILPSFTAAHQIIPGRSYLELGGLPIFIENGFDLDGNGIDNEVYDYAKLTRFLDARYGRAGFLPGTASRAWHDWDFNGRQDDWRQDPPDVKLFHIYGESDINDTPAQTFIERTVRCLSISGDCVDQFPDPVVVLGYTQGDKTVPILSASRQSELGNYNAPHARTFLCKRNGGSNPNVEHTGMLTNSVVQNLILQFLGEATGAAERPLPSSTDCGAGIVRPETLPRTAASEQTVAADTVAASYRVHIVGAETINYSDSLGNNNAIITGTVRSIVPSITHYSAGDRVHDLIFAPGNAYTMTWPTTDEPLAIAITLADETATTAAIRYQDLNLPVNVTARLRVTASGFEPLRFDGDNNGSFETEVPPTVAVSGAAANDTTPPTVIGSAVPVGNLAELTLSAQDASGVAQLFYALDGTIFKEYTSTLTVDPTVVPVVYAFADDMLANRSSVQRFYLPNPAAPDLAVTVTPNSGLQVGDSLTYAIDIRNLTNAATTAPILLTDTLPIGSSLISGSGTGWNCQANGGVATCTHEGPLTGNATLPRLTIMATTAVQTFPTAYNLVKVATAGDPNPLNNVAETRTDLKSVTDLRLRKTHAGNFTVGVTDLYTLTVSNDGPLPAAGPITVVDTLPAGLVYESAAGNGWSCDNQGQTVTCTYASMVGGGDLSPLVVQVQVLESALGGVTNSATVSAPNIVDSNPDNNSATDPTSVVEGANLNLFLRSDALQGEYVVPWVVGQNRRYHFIVSNNGPSTAQGPLTVVDTLPPGTQYIGMEGAEWRCDALGQTVTCQSATPIPAGLSSNFAVSVTVEAAAVPEVVNLATVTGLTPDADPSDNSSSDTTSVFYGADLALAVAAPRPFITGTNVYTLSVANLGPIDMAQSLTINANVVSDVPDSVAVSGFSGSGWECFGLPVFASCAYPGPVGTTDVVPDLRLTVTVTGSNGTRIDGSFQLFAAAVVQTVDFNNGNNFVSVRRFVGVVTQSPQPADDGASTVEDQALSIPVLENDFDPDGDLLVISGVGVAGNGTITTDGAIAYYTPAPNVNGSDSFTYTVSDNNGGTGVATVFVTIAPVNDAPVAAEDVYQIAANTRLTVTASNSILGNDSDVEGDALTATLANGPANGTLDLSPDGTFIYTPSGAAAATDSFTYRASDGTADSNEATVHIQVPSRPGDCNADQLVDAGDLAAIVLEIFDDDGDLPNDAPNGTFPGSPFCDTNADTVIDAGDLSCTILVIFNGPGACVVTTAVR